MKNFTVLCTFILLCFFLQAKNNINPKRNESVSSLSGTVIDKETREPLPGVSVYFPDLKTGAVTDIDGKYSISGLPSVKLLVRVQMLGYSTIVRTIDLSTADTANFELEESITELKEITVPGFSQATEQKRAPSPISVITNVDLRQNTSNNLIDAMTKEPGINQVSTGAGISKPVIRGLGYNRVVVVNDGIRQEGQQWGDEHGTEVDENSVYKIEVLKGPASLAYGSDAIAGVINLVSAPTIPKGEVRGEALTSWQSNNGMFNGSLMTAGNLKGFIWDMRYSRKLAHDYRNKADGYVFNTGFNEESFRLITGLNKSWGFTHLHFSNYVLKPEIAEGERDSATGKFLKEVRVNDTLSEEVIAGDEDLKSYELNIPSQRVVHRKLVSNNTFFIRKARLNLIAGWQQNERKEQADILSPGSFGLHFLLNTYNYDARFLFPEKNGIQTAAGVNGMRQMSENRGEEFLVPAYKLFDVGAYFTVRKSWEKTELSGGIRGDYRSINTENLFLDSAEQIVDAPLEGGEIVFSSVSRMFSNVTGSVGVSRSFGKYFYTKLNVARGFRTPNIAELAANGVHEGTMRFLIGNPDMKAENSVQGDLGVGLDSKHISAEVNVFYNSLSNYIYLTKLSSISGGDSLTDAEGEQLLTFKYTQSSAVLSGGEVSFDMHPHPLDWLHFKNTFSYVRAVQPGAPDSMKNLPFIPAPRFTSELKAEVKKLSAYFKNFFFRVQLEAFTKQNKVYRAYNTETETPAYAIMNAGIGIDFAKKNTTYCSLLFSVNNLFDTVYQSHLSRLKYAPFNYANNRSGMFNMGRNFAVKLIVPFTIKKAKAA